MNMIVAGLKLTFLGMGVVFFFLLLLILFIKVSYWFLSAGSAKELAEMKAAERKKTERPLSTIEDDLLMAIISAAVATHRSQSRSVQ